MKRLILAVCLVLMMTCNAVAWPDWGAITGSGETITGTKTVTVAGSAEQITATSTPVKGVWVSADLGNTGIIVVGDSSVVAADGFQQGWILIPGNPPLFLEHVTDLNELYVDSQTNGDKLCYAYVR